MDTSVSSRQCQFFEIISERRRRYVVETRMAPLAVVENFDVLLDRRFRVGGSLLRSNKGSTRDRLWHAVSVCVGVDAKLNRTAEIRWPR